MTYRIGLDVDGVLYQFSKTAQYMMAKRAGLETREELPWDDSTWDCGRSPEEWKWVLAHPQTEWVFRHGHLWSGAIEFAYSLAELGEVVLITKRPSHATRVTLDWIRYHFDHDPFPFAEVHILGDDRKKSEVPADIYIDDSLDNANDIMDNTQSHLLLVDRPWNKVANYLNPRMTRVYTFEETLKEVGWRAKLSSKRRGESSTVDEATTTDIRQTTLSEWEGFGQQSSEWNEFHPNKWGSAWSASSSPEKSTSPSETTELTSQAMRRHYK